MWVFQFGVYHYSYVSSLENAVLEAKNCLKFINGKKLDLPIFYDLEDKITKPLGKDIITKCAITFCEEIEKAGYKAGVYANLDWFTNYIDVNKLIEKGFKIWLAQWNDKPTADFPINYWQYSSKGSVHGIQGNVDLDIAYDEIKNQQPVENSVDNRYKIGRTYITQVNLKVRTGAGTWFSQKLFKDLTINAKLHSFRQNFAVLKKGTKVTCLETKIENNNIWIRIPSRLDCRFLSRKNICRII